jgi:hypothetical protein
MRAIVMGPFSSRVTVTPSSMSIESCERVFSYMCSCKKICDDKGYWEQVEVYIRDHSEAEFSHGICPEYMKKLYPEIATQNSKLKEE